MQNQPARGLDRAAEQHRPFRRDLGDLDAELLVDLAERPVLFGGPIETARGLVLHSADYKREETLLIEGGMALTASLEILKDMAGGSGPKQAWLALGHSGWQPGQLDREMQDNAWLVVDADAALVFDPDLEAKWQRALDRLGGKTALGTRFDPASYSHQVGRA